MEIIATVTAYALLVIITILAIRKGQRRMDQIFVELSKSQTLLKNASKREQKTNYILARHTSKLEKIVRKVSR